MIASLHGILVDQDAYDIISNFCEDFKIENVPIRENMFYPLRVADGIEDKIPTHNKTTYNIFDIELFEVDAVSGEGKTLIAVGNCPPLLDFRKEAVRGTDEDDEDFEFVEFVISNDFDGEYDLEFLNAKLREYLPSVSMSEFFTRYLDPDDIFDFVLDGRIVEET